MFQCLVKQIERGRCFFFLGKHKLSTPSTNYPVRRSENRCIDALNIIFQRRLKKRRRVVQL